MLVICREDLCAFKISRVSLLHGSRVLFENRNTSKFLLSHISLVFLIFDFRTDSQFECIFSMLRYYLNILWIDFEVLFFWREPSQIYFTSFPIKAIVIKPVILIKCNGYLELI